MGTSRFEPRSFAVEPELFGKTRQLQWRPVEGRDQLGRQAASVTQHQFCYAVRMRLKQHGHTVPRFAVLSGIKADRLRRLLRGEGVMQLEDIGRIRMMLHIGMNPTSTSQVPLTNH